MQPLLTGGSFAKKSVSCGPHRLGQHNLRFRQRQLAGDQARQQGVAERGEGLGLLPVMRD
jgi:hypothetical protein